MGNATGSNFFLDFINWLLSLFAPKPGPLSMPRKVLAIVFRPPGPKYAARSAAWSDPETLMQQYIAKMAEVSGGQLTYAVTDQQTGAYFPVLQDGRCYDDDSWDAAKVDDSKAFHTPGNKFYEPVDYARILADFNVLQAVKSKSVDEVWLFGGPLFGFAESAMVGKDAFPCNGPAFPADSPRFVVMGFNYERSVDEMVHDYGHRVESILVYHFGSATLLNAMYPANYPDDQPLPPNAQLPAPQNEFDQFLLDNGTVHRTPSGLAYSQDVANWLSKLKAEWWPPTIDPNRA